MTTIITGNFQQQDGARNAMHDLAGAGFSADRMTTFFVNPPGQHDRYPIGGDEDQSAGTEHVPSGSMSGAAAGGAVGVAVGLATVPVLGPAAAVAAAGVGAYVGSLYGALGNTDDGNNAEVRIASGQPHQGESLRKTGMLVAVSVPASAEQATAMRILRERGATDIERLEGNIVAGVWADFDPLTPLKPVTGG